MLLLLACLLSYMLGSIPFGLILVYLFSGKKLTKEGSGNIGTTNVLRVSTKSLALATLILDVTKGFIVAFICKENGLHGWYLTGLLAVIGHMFPVGLKFKGGKGVASFLGFTLAINFYLFIMVLLTWLAVAILFRISSLAALVAMCITPIYALIVHCTLGAVLSILALVVIIIVKHKSNIIRLLKQQESKIRLRK